MRLASRFVQTCEAVPSSLLRAPGWVRLEARTLMDTVFDAFMATAKAAPEHPFLCAPPSPGRAYHPDGVEYTYAQVRAEALALRERYAAAGYGHGHRVGLLFENRPEFFFHYLGLNALGDRVVHI